MRKCFLPIFPGGDDATGNEVFIKASEGVGSVRLSWLYDIRCSILLLPIGVYNVVTVRLLTALCLYLRRWICQGLQCGEVDE